jgi:ribosomal-protein-alanine N-acetyltransferase
MVIDIGKFNIRDWQKSDVSSIAKYANNRKIWENLRDGFPHPYNFSDAERFISLVLSQEPRTYFAIASNEEAIGSIGLGLGSDVHRFTAELGYWLAEPYATNPASARVLEKSGYSLEGTLKANVYKDGRILDQNLYSRVRKNLNKVL